MQTNIYVIVAACTFVNTFIEAHTNQDFSEMIKEQIETFGIGLVYNALKHKLDQDEFNLDDVSYERAMKSLHEEKYTPHYAAIDNFYFNNLDDFEPSKPLIYPHHKILEIFQ